MNLAQILAKAQNADCPRCGSDPLEDCWPDFHLERAIRARAYGFVSDAEFMAVIAAATAFTLEAAFRLEPAGSAP